MKVRRKRNGSWKKRERGEERRDIIILKQKAKQRANKSRVGSYNQLRRRQRRDIYGE